MIRTPAATPPTRAQVDATPGPLLLAFGTDWCGHCLAAHPPVQAVLQAHPDLPYVWVEDGPGRALGRSYRVKLWPTLIGLVNGEERFRLVRPTAAEPLLQALQTLQDPPPA